MNLCRISDFNTLSFKTFFDGKINFLLRIHISSYCIVSLEELLNLGTATKIPQSYPTIIVQVASNRSENGSFLLGLTVNRILRTVTLRPEDIMSPVGEFPAALTPYLQGYLVHDEQQIALLDLTAIQDQMGSDSN